MWLRSRGALWEPRRSVIAERLIHLATGLLLITIGRGTKIQDLLMSEDKEYVGTIRLGEVTDSQDADGQIIETNPVRTSRGKRSSGPSTNSKAISTRCRR